MILMIIAAVRGAFPNMASHHHSFQAKRSSVSVALLRPTPQRKHIRDLRSFDGATLDKIEGEKNVPVRLSEGRLGIWSVLLLLMPVNR